MHSTSCTLYTQTIIMRDLKILQAILLFPALVAIATLLYGLGVLDAELGARQIPYGVSLYITLPPSSQQSAWAILAFLCIFTAALVFRIKLGQISFSVLVAKLSTSLYVIFAFALLVGCLLIVGSIFLLEFFNECRTGSAFRGHLVEFRRKRPMNRRFFGFLGCQKASAVQRRPPSHFRIGSMIETENLPSSIVGTDVPSPVPFNSFSNLCFNATNSTFLAFGDKCDLSKGLADAPGRGFRALQYTSLKPYYWSSNDRIIPGTTILLAELLNTASYFQHFFHVLEHVVGIWSFGGAELRQDVERIVLLAPLYEDFSLYPHLKKGKNQLSALLVEALFPNADILTWSEFVNSAAGGALSIPSTDGAEAERSLPSIACMERALTSDRILSITMCPDCTRLNKMLGGAARHVPAAVMLQMAAAMWDANAVPQPLRRPPHTRVTYSRRAPVRTFTPAVEAAVLAAIATLAAVELRTVGFAGLTFAEQIRLIADSDVLFGVHGNGLSHALFLPPDAVVIEVFPAGVLAIDYRMMAQVRGVEYHGIVAGRGPVGDEEAYRTGAYGDVNQPVTELNLSAVTDVIERARKAKRLL